MSVYNGECYLREAVDSILCQTFVDFEFIIINDGSTDHSREILESYDDSRIVLVNQENAGLATALNRGIGIAHAPLIARMDADDISMPTRVERQITFMREHSEVVLLGTSALTLTPGGSKVPTEFAGGWRYVSWEDCIEANNAFVHGSTVFRANVARNLGGYRSEFSAGSTASEDYDLWLRMLERGRGANLLDPLYIWRMPEGPMGYRREYVQRDLSAIIVELAQERRNFGEDRLQRNESLMLSFAGRSRYAERFAAHRAHRAANLCMMAGDYSSARRFAFWAVSRLPLFLEAWWTALLASAGPKTGKLLQNGRRRVVSFLRRASVFTQRRREDKRQASCSSLRCYD